jgi:hypothetical protein
MEKYTIWILVALIAYVLFKDKLFAAGGVSGGFSAGTRGPVPGPSPSGNTYANTPPGTISPGPQAPTNNKNFWDVLDTGIKVGGAAYETYETYNS